MIKGILFDYNGTLFFDEEYNRNSWKKCLLELTDNKIDFEPFYKEHCATMDYLIIRKACDLYNITYDEEFINKWVHHKEELYQKECIESGKLYLSESTINFLNYIKEKNIPINMATASIKFNCDFYFKYLHLDNWFNQDLISYDNGYYSSKKEMYEDAAKKINVDIKDCVVLEDSKNSMRQAIEAGCKKIIYVNSKNLKLDYPEIIQEVKDFKDIDLKIFE